MIQHNMYRVAVVGQLGDVVTYARVRFHHLPDEHRAALVALGQELRPPRGTMEHGGGRCRREAASRHLHNFGVLLVVSHLVVYCIV